MRKSCALICLLFISICFSIPAHSQGQFWGVTYQGGSNNQGTIFKANADGTGLISAMDFTGAATGTYPFGTLVRASNGRLYGTANSGGAGNYGVIFEIDPLTLIFSKKADFNNGNGAYPQAGLTDGGNGKLYGTAPNGGTGGQGTIYEFDPLTGSLLKKFDFIGPSTGSNPAVELTLATNGLLYGITQSGGVNNVGALFEFDPLTSTFTKKIDFLNSTGGNPRGKLLMAADGNLYGTTYGGGASGGGVIFRYSLNGTYTKIYDFVAATGLSPYAGLTQASNGKFYGTTVNGASGSVLYEFDLNGSIYTKKDLSTISGTSTYNGVTEVNGKIYGACNNGGSTGKGILFEYDYTTGTLVKKSDFTGTNGANPYYSTLLYLPPSPDPTISVAHNGWKVQPDTTVYLSPVQFTPATFSLTVSNLGTQNLDLSDPSFSGSDAADFSISPDTGSSLATGQAADFTITYSPTPGGGDIRSARLTFNSNDPAKPAFNINLAGTGIYYGPKYPPSGTISADTNGEAGRAGGRNIMLTAVSLGTKTPTYWGPQVTVNGDVQLKVSLDGSTYTGKEVLTFDPSRSSFAGGVAAWKGETFIQNAITFTTVKVFIRATMTAKRTDNSTIPLTDPTSIGLPRQIGGLVPFVNLSDYLVANFFIEASTSPTSGWQPYLNFYDAYPTPAGPLPGQGIGNAYSSITNGFYWKNLPPTLTRNFVLNVNEGGTAKIDSLVLFGADQEDMPGNAQGIQFQFESNTSTNSPLNFATGLIKKNGVTLSKTDVFTMQDLRLGKITFEHDGSETTYDEFQFSFKDSRGAQGVDGPNSVYTFKINIIPVNDPPTTADVTVQGSYLIPTYSFLVVSDPDNNPPLTTRILSGPASGNVTMNITGSDYLFIYTPTSAQTVGTTDSFTYTANDGNSDGNTSTVTITFVNAPPIIDAHVTKSSFAVFEGDGPSVQPVVAFDPEGGPVTLSLGTPPSKGTVANLTPTGFAYQPPTNFFGIEKFSIVATDDQGTPSKEFWFLVTIHPSLNEGELLITDRLTIRLVDPITLQDAAISQSFDFNADAPAKLEKGINDIVVPKWPLRSAQNIYYKKGTSVFVVDRDQGIFKFDRNWNGTMLSDAHGFAVNPGLMGLTMDSQGALVVTDGSPVIYKVDTLSGAATPIDTGHAVSVATGVEYLANGDLIVSDAAAFAGGTSKIVRITPAGVQTIVSQGNKLNVPVDFALLDESTIVVADAGSMAGSVDRVIKIDLATGIQTILAEKGGLASPTGIGVNRSNGKIYVVNQRGPNVMEVDASTGALTTLHLGARFEQPFGLFVIPAVAPPILPDVYATAPADGATGLNVSLNITSKTLKGATTYTIQVSPKSNFSSGVLEKSGSRVQKFTGLSYGTKYYVRVKTNLSPTFGKVTTFKTGIADLFTYISSPANGATGLGLTVNLTSIVVSGAIQYTIELNTALDFLGSSVVKTGSKTQSFSGLSASTTYYSRVKTELSTDWGPIKSFTTASISTLTYVTVPANNAANASWLPAITISNVAASTYTLQLSPFQDFSANVEEYTSSTNKVTVTLPLAFDTKYYSRVKTNLSINACTQQCNAALTTCISNSFGDPDSEQQCQDQNVACLGGCSDTWGPVKSFTTALPAYFAYVTSPANGATNVNFSTNVTANLVPGAGAYTIELNPDPLFGEDTKIEKTSGSRTMAFVLEPSMTYHSRVKTDLSDGAYGATRSFMTGSSNSLSYITAPANGATNVNFVAAVTANKILGVGLYTIELNTSPDFDGASITLSSSKPTISFTLSEGQIYYGRVKTDLDPDDWGTTIHSFTTGTATSLAFVTVPKNGATNVATTIKVTANAVGNANSYTIQLSTASDFSAAEAPGTPPWTQTSSSRAITFTELIGGVTYYARVHTNLADGSWGPTTNFATAAPVAAAPAQPAQPAAPAGRIGTTVAGDGETTLQDEVILPDGIVTFPNPFVSTFTLQVNSKEKTSFRIQITDLSGRVLHEGALSPGQASEQLGADWSGGLYIIKANSTNQTFTSKVIKN